LFAFAQRFLSLAAFGLLLGQLESALRRKRALRKLFAFGNFTIP
jgi:hypothetical protein